MGIEWVLRERDGWMDGRHKMAASLSFLFFFFLFFASFRIRGAATQPRKERKKKERKKEKKKRKKRQMRSVAKQGIHNMQTSNNPTVMDEFFGEKTTPYHRTWKQSARCQLYDAKQDKSPCPLLFLRLRTYTPNQRQAKPHLSLLVRLKHQAKLQKNCSWAAGKNASGL